MSEDITQNTSSDSDTKKTDFVKISSNLVSNISIKIGFFLFIIGMFIFSDIFIDGILSNIPDTVHGECTTTKGSMIQLLLFVIAYLILDIAVKFEWL